MKLLIILCALASFVLPANAQKTPAAIQTEITSSSANGLLGGAILNDITKSFVPQIPVAGGLTQAIGIQQFSFSGTAAASTNVYINQIDIVDTAIVPGSDGNGANFFSFGLRLDQFFGGSSVTGGRIGIGSALTLSAATSSANTNRNYVALYGLCQAGVSDGGTGTTSITSKGSCYGLNAVALAINGATNLSGVVGEEIDIEMATGSSAFKKIGLAIVQQVGDAVSGATFDIAMSFGNQAGTPGWSTGIDFGSGAPSFPLKTTAVAINFAAGTIATVLDASALTMTTFLKGVGFSVNGSGLTTGTGYVATAAAPTVAAAQIGYGSTTTANTNCGTLAGSAGCVVINVAGTTHYVPYY